MKTEHGFAQRFEDLSIWQTSRTLVGTIYLSFRDLSDFGYRDQIHRAAVSVMNNIAEGFEQRSPTNFARYLDIAKASAGEVRSMLYLAEDLSYLNPNQAKEIRNSYEILSRQIAKFTSTLRK
ncbi:MAG: four helix bundle protein [Puniceicoccales bacterium]